MTNKKLASYLRCSNSKPSEQEHKCVECPYRNLEPVANHPGMSMIPPDITINYADYWLDCDYERLCADIIERLEGTNE